ncbi:MAG: CxxxxCH/CxxCH domain-containing protein [Candidatus Kryptonium sp.]|nr:CxxxxCH/CxxCH domain-containing protein [Candidatus Kryptonium sp.]MDW8108807.1 CxxxxCH/CxxCH domain-containing protein [Candidatus Kryptonium sp.]
MKARVLILFALISIIFLSCSQLKEDVLTPPVSAKLTYKDDIKKILDESCVRCHNVNSQDFDLSTYFGIVQSGIAIPGDPTSKIILVTQPGGSKRQFLGDDAPAKAEKIRKWVVEDSIAYGTIKIHPSDWVQVTSPNSHGKFLRSIRWDFDNCKQCHGSNYTGGVSKSSCYTCHNTPAGPEACNTCHGNLQNSAPPRDLNNNFSASARGVGAHQVHLKGGQISSGYDCVECHIQVTSLRTPGHLDNTPYAEIVFNDSALAKNRTPIGIGEYLVPNPVYSFDNLTCSNTYCHGYFRNGNLNNAPKWNVVDGTQARCGTCHGLPPGGTHPRVSATSCATACHNDVVELQAGQLRIKDKTKHVNGKLSLYGYELEFTEKEIRKISALNLK